MAVLSRLSQNCHHGRQQGQHTRVWQVSRTLISDNKASFSFNALLLFFLLFFFSLFLTKKPKQSRPKIMGANRSDNINQNPGSCHNLGQYLSAKGRPCTENHLHCIRTPLIHSDLKLKDCFIKNKNVSFCKKCIPMFVCGLSMFSYELPLLN